MGKGIESAKIVHYDAFSFEETEAKTLHNSKGAKKGRIHLLSHDALEGQDRYAVAAEVLKSKDGEAPKLGWWDRQFNIVARDDEGTWYKVNKRSLIKRLNVDPVTIECFEAGTLTFLSAVENSINSVPKLQEKSNASTPFEKEFLHQLSQGTDVDAYNQILFVPAEDNFVAPEAQNEPVLVITYDQIKQKSSVISPYRAYKKTFELDDAVGVHINHSQYKKILLGNPIPEEIITLIKDEKLDLPKGLMQIENEKRKIAVLNFSSDTRTSQMDYFLLDAKESLGADAHKKFTLRVGIDVRGRFQYKSHYNVEIANYLELVSYIKSLEVSQSI